MRAKISDTVKSNVIREWLKGTARDTSASKNGVSAGAVTNTINEWKAGLDYPGLDELRDFTVTLKNSGINPSQCASGLRLVVMLQKMGVDEENLASFISEVYSYCREVDLPPAKIAFHVKQLVELAQSVPLSQIQEQIQQQVAEKKKVEIDIMGLRDQESLAKYDLDKAREENKELFVELKNLRELKSQLEKLGIRLDDIPRFAKTMNAVRELGYDPGYIISMVSNIHTLKAQHMDLTETVAFLDRMRTKLQYEDDYLQEQVAYHTQSMSKYEELESMGFGLKELKLLWYIILEIADANKIPADRAIQKFFTDVEQQYDDKLGFEGKVQNLKSESRMDERVKESNRIAINNQSSGFIDLTDSIASLFEGREPVQGPPNIRGKFQGIDPAFAASLQQPANANTRIGFSDHYAPQYKHSIKDPWNGYERVVVDRDHFQHLFVFVDGSWRHSDRCGAYANKECRKQFLNTEHRN